MKKNDFRHVVLLLITVTLAGVGCSTLTPREPPQSDALATLVSSASSSKAEDFSGWVSTLEDRYPGVTSTLSQARSGEALDENQIEWFGRLLGVWNLAQNEAEALQLLEQAVAIPTFYTDDYPDQYDNPEFIRFGKFIKTIANDFGLDYRNVDGRIYEVTLEGDTDEAFGVLTHADVVPVDASNWGLEDGTKLDPFRMKIIGNKIYGRGTLDDKGSIITALYAMKAVKESGLAINRDIRLMIETTEETSGMGMEYYMEHNSVPDYNIVLDSDYPAVTAEKGYGTINAWFPASAVMGDTVITNMTGGTATNQIPGTATATIKSANNQGLIAKINAFADDYKDGPNGTFGISAKEMDGRVVLTVTGVSAHASEPETGNNPLPRLMQILVESSIKPARNHWLAASEYINNLYGVDYSGEKIGVSYSDDFMGPLHLSPTFVAFGEDTGARVAVNIRAPRGMSKEELKMVLEEKLNAWNATTPEAVTFDVSTTDWMYRDPSGKWLATLLDIYAATTGKSGEPVSSPGSTTAKLLPNAINFGPNMPGDKYMGHNANEFKRLDVFRYDLQMFTEMMVRIGNLDRFE